MSKRDARRGRRAGATSAFALALFSSASAATADSRTIDAPAIYEFSESPEELRALDEELDRVARQFNPLIRGIARKKLHDRIRPYAQLRFEPYRDTFSIQLGPKTVVPCHGRWVDVRGNQDEPGRGRCQVDGRRLVTQTKYEKAVRKNEVTVEREGRLSLKAELRSPKLPDVIRFQLTYGQAQRKD